jgi:tRNA-5-methyluridine54 2-sulfurtransferase
MKCTKCSQTAVFSRPDYCERHFTEYVEKKVLETVRKHGLVSGKDNVVVAASGGKDSVSCLYILSKHLKNVRALAIDEGIIGYRQHTLAYLKRFCKAHNIPLKIYSAKKELGVSLDNLVKQGQHGCTACGALRRHIMNMKAKELKATKLATGHNLDDEAQAVMMNLLRNNMAVSARLGPITGVKRLQGFVPRIKPLYFCTEKEIAAYAFLKGFEVPFAECPYASSSYRWSVLYGLNELEGKRPGTKKKIIESHLKMQPKLKEGNPGGPNTCKMCGEPCAGKMCKVCSIITSTKKIKLA